MTVFMCGPTVKLKANENLMVIFDASGSMWEKSGQHDRLSIAKEAVDKLISDLPESTNLGLTVYGHRRKGDCEDIQMFSETSNRDQLRQRLQNVTARGKTPLGASIEQSARQLAKTDTRSRIVALTDGLETCGFDLCELANTLKRTGTELEIDVVAFDLKEEDVSSLRCLSDITGGTYYNAAGFEGLSVAFESISAKSNATISDLSVESANLTHAAKAELGSQLPIEVNAELTDGKMYMLTIVPDGADAKTMTPVVSKVLQLGDIKGSGQNELNFTLSARVLRPGNHEVRLLSMLENRIVLSSKIELFQPGQLSDTDKELVIGNSSEHSFAAGFVFVEALDRASTGKFLDFTVKATGNASVVSGIYQAQLVSPETSDGEFPKGSTRTTIVLGDKPITMKLRTPDIPGEYELRIVKNGQTTTAARLPVSVY